MNRVIFRKSCRGSKPTWRSFNMLKGDKLHHDKHKVR